MPCNKERNNEYQPKYLYIEDYPIDPEKVKKQQAKEQKDDDDNRGVIVIEIL